MNPGRYFSRLVGLCAGAVAACAGVVWFIHGRWESTVFWFLVGSVTTLVFAWLVFPRLSTPNDLSATLQKREQELLDKNAELKATSELKTRFLANVSHELRTPLTSIVAYTRMLEDEVKGPLTPPQREILGKVAHHAESLMTLISDLLDISRIEAGRLDFTMGLVSLADCLESAYGMIEAQLQAKGLTFSVDLPEQPITVRGSFNRLRQVFVNLLGNAVKFTEAGEIGMRAREVDGQAEIRVWDTGPGISEESLSFIFDEFRQADDSVRRRYGGSGLGLAICRKLIQLHDGEIRAEKREPHGTTFVVRIPLTPRG